MNKLNKELLERALVEGVDMEESAESFVYLATDNNDKYTGFHLSCRQGNYYWQYVCTKEEYLAAKAEKESRKTVMDAVNKFKADIHTGVKSFVCNQNSGSIHAWFDDDFTALNTPIWTPLCSLAEYKEAMAECEINFGTSQSYAEYKKGYKTMSGRKSEYDIGCYYEFSDDADFIDSHIGVLVSVNGSRNKSNMYPFECEDGPDYKYLRPLTAKAGEIKKPKALRGFVNIDADGYTGLYSDKGTADINAHNDRIACIDLSQFNEGEEL